MPRQPTHTFLFFMLLVAVTLSTQFTSVASADVHSHLDSIAVRINRRANQIVRETKRFKHAPEYIHLRADAQELSRLASHIHEVTHFEGNLGHLEADIAELDRQFHHLESVFDRVEINARIGYGSVHGSTRNLRRLLNLIEDDLYHLQEDVASLRAPAYCPITNRSPIPTPIIIPPTPIYGHGGHRPHVENQGFGLSFGNGRSRITFRF